MGTKIRRVVLKISYCLGSVCRLLEMNMLFS